MRAWLIDKCGFFGWVASRSYMLFRVQEFLLIGLFLYYENFTVFFYQKKGSDPSEMELNKEYNVFKHTLSKKKTTWTILDALYLFIEKNASVNKSVATKSQ